jgi:hypothetical protein
MTKSSKHASSRTLRPLTLDALRLVSGGVSLLGSDGGVGDLNDKLGTKSAELK